MQTSLSPTTWNNHRLEWGAQTHVMGILNITPDSFSGDGLAAADLTQEEIVTRALFQAQKFVEE
jgi:dihydropteroate synthase